MRSLGRIWSLLVCFFLASCQAMHTGPAMDVSSAEQMEQILAQSPQSQDSSQSPSADSVPPESISDALFPPMTLQGADAAQEARFDISVKKLAVRDFFIGLVEGTPYNIVVHPEVEGTISLDLKDVTVAQVMQVIRSTFGYDYDYSAAGQLYRVLPTGIRTEIFKINYPNVQRTGSSETQVSAGQMTTGDSSDNNSSSDQDSDTDSGDNNSDVRGLIGTRIRTQTRADFWSSLTETLTTIIGAGDGRRVVVSPQTGIVVVRAFSDELRNVASFLDKSELSLRRQVILEAKILEVQLNDGFQAGINWAAIGSMGSGKSVFVSQSSVPLSAPNQIGGVFSAAFDLTDVSALIELLGTQGTVQVLSSPRISTVNNQKAVIKVGTDEFFVTNLKSQTTTTTTASIPTVDVELTPFFSGIALDVTPQISEAGEIILHIHPTISEVEDQTKTVESPSGALILPLALSTIRESDSVVRARDGQVVVIGGLMQNTATDDVSASPGLSNIPLLGHLFRQKRQVSKKSELVILLKPIIADDQSWQTSIEQSRESITRLRKEIEPGLFK